MRRGSSKQLMGSDGLPIMSGNSPGRGSNPAQGPQEKARRRQEEIDMAEAAFKAAAEAAEKEEAEAEEARLELEAAEASEAKEGQEADEAEKASKAADALAVKARLLLRLLLRLMAYLTMHVLPLHSSCTHHVPTVYLLLTTRGAGAAGG